ncbi:delta-60 repeat domain-containing protein [Nocardiopsis sp. FIRDI 009]|uniref:delta-60 repeat domain-containing protein n=1 Tax=Nocardiopsis sp. FIRDI 009 TaxID=714197 RepID=UPI000E285812|nr:delta-60 repeat domain-containing protein [Nocardiopsis sp. FIRDI 009]
MKPTRFTALAMSALLLFPAGAAVSAPAASAATEGIVSERPAPWTPHVLNGRIKDILRVGDVVVVAGDFDRVADSDHGTTHDRRNLFAFEHGTGRVIESFAPDVPGSVNSVVEGPDGSVIIGGDFSAVNGQWRRGLARIALGDGATVADFTARLDDGAVNRLATDGTDVYVAGDFDGLNGTERVGLARIDARTGTLDPDFAPRISEPRRGGIRLGELALSPDGGRLLINGTFTRVDGEERHQIAMIDTASGALTPWSTSAFEPDCDYSRMHTYMRQMSFSPDGSYFAVVTAGGPRIKPGLCKAAVRFEVTDTPDATPTWFNKTGGDALYSVEVTDAAVYVGGHQRWMDNEQGAHNAGPGSVEREGIGAIDPETGRALPWNPGRDRGHGVEALHATPDGLYVGSDTERLGGEYRARLGLFPPA